VTNFDGPLDPLEDEFQQCPQCDGCGCTCGATDCNRHCCSECHDDDGECILDGECGWIPTARYMEIMRAKLEDRRLGWLKAILILLVPNFLFWC